VRLPPLRERPGDIPLLVEAFYRELTADPAARPPPELVGSLAQHDWPGNVRELRAAVERSLLIDDPSEWRALLDEPLDAAGDGSSAPADEFDESLSFRAAKERATLRWERWYLAELLRRSEGNLSRASRAARMDRTHLRELARRYRLIAPGSGDPDGDR
jgi:two-component system, NtrC family, response regulator GlrR